MAKKVCLLLPFLVILTSCLTYYERTQNFHNAFEHGNFEAAKEILASADDPKDKDRLLHYFNLGVTEFMLGNYQVSNEHFEDAYRMVETEQEETAKKLATLLSNPRIQTYLGEDHEILLIHYFKALNFLFMGNYDKALVECRRLNIKLTELNDKYNNKNRYKRDAFSHLLMGLIYDANQDYNNAFIAYRNAYDIYKEDYLKHFNNRPPVQLKRDMLRTADKAGLSYELKQYQKEFEVNYKKDRGEQGSLVFFWHNGLGPIKKEIILNFVLVRGSGGALMFRNDKFGWTFPVPTNQKKEKSELSDVEFVKMALPRYSERPPVFKSGALHNNQSVKQLELSENINAIAFKTLKDRIFREMGNALMRLATKKAAEHTLRNENEGLGALLGAINALTEHANTRNWQTLPHSIYYSRMWLPEGKQNVQLVTKNGQGDTSSFNFSYHIKAGQTVFDLFHTLNTKGSKYHCPQEWYQEEG